MKKEKRIYCIEGQWNWGKTEVEPSVEPILQMLQKMGQWDYARRDCATLPEMQFWLKHEWTQCQKGSILYIASHGSKGRIWLTSEAKDNKFISLCELADFMPECNGRLVHFSGCNIVAAEDAVREFIERTGAACVTGYGAEVGWADTTWPPALALELILFSSISTKGIKFEDGRNLRPLRRLVEDLFKENELFRRCKLKLFP